MDLIVAKTTEKKMQHILHIYIVKAPNLQKSCQCPAGYENTTTNLGWFIRKVNSTIIHIIATLSVIIATGTLVLLWSFLRQDGGRKRRELNWQFMILVKNQSQTVLHYYDIIICSPKEHYRADGKRHYIVHINIL